ncbi:MFS transporter [Sphingomonas nostoxanthinifaciens]|uniref:MFS transporter n=1 Tax=Sphingomonas nostoxanthinifaciens TaxID=2872652 RepID=UPI001CC21E5C|nr:MFS transporter [Sphingomonas nostoxanthinifaciens]UAK25649.1 MFS transporter [Sphingomonas nostoxanthinifaciens]
MVIGAVAVIAAAIVTVRHLYRMRTGLFDMGLLDQPSFAHAMAGGSLVRMAILANPFLLPLMLQAGLGYSPTGAGLLILIGMCGNIAVKFTTTSVLRRWHYRQIKLVNGIALSVGFAAFALVGADVSTAWLIVLLLFTGGGRSIHFTALNTLAFTDVPANRMASASTLASAVQQINGALGVAVAALSIQLSAALHGRGNAAVLADYRTGFLAIAVLTLIGSLDARRLDPGQRAMFNEGNTPR